MATRVAPGRSSAAKGQIALLAAAVVSMASGLIISLIVARAAGSAEFGFFALLASILPIARDATDLGTANVTARRITRFPSQECNAVSELLAWRRLPALLGAAAITLLALAQELIWQQLLMLGASLCVLLYVNNGFIAMFQAHQRLAIPAALTIVLQLITLAACALLALSSAPPIAYPLVILAREAAGACLLRLLAIRTFAWRPARGPVVAGKHGELGPMAMSALAFQLSIAAGLVMISLAHSAEELGIYGAAFRLAAPFFALAWVLASPMVPQFVRAAEAGHLPKELSRAAEMPVVATAIGAAFVAATSADIIGLLYGSEYAAAAAVLPVLMAAVAANAGAAFFATGMIAGGADRIVLVIALAVLVLTVVVSALLVQQHASVGAAYALAAGLSAGFVATAVAAIGIARMGSLGARALLAVTAILIIGVVMPLNGLPRLAVLAAAAAAILVADRWIALRHG